MYEAPKIKIIAISIANIVCQSEGSLSIANYDKEEETLDW